MSISRATLLLLAVLLTTAVSAKTIYVDDDAAGSGDGTSWTDAYAALQDALAAASSGDEILVAAGVYKPDRGVGINPGNRNVSFSLKAGVILRGGIGGTSTLSGDLLGNDALDFTNRGDNSHRVVTCTVGWAASPTLDGFTVTGGCALADPFQGGGLYCATNASPVITNCVFRDNIAQTGGALHTDNFRSTISNCSFINNVATAGGALCTTFDVRACGT